MCSRVWGKLAEGERAASLEPSKHTHRSPSSWASTDSAYPRCPGARGENEGLPMLSFIQHVCGAPSLCRETRGDKICMVPALIKLPVLWGNQILNK